MNSTKIKAGNKVFLKDFPASAPNHIKKKQIQQELSQLNEQLESLQEILYAEHQHKMLVVLQGMDTSGKDSTIRSVFQEVNPAHVRVASFKVPSAEELDHDFLWRIHQQVPKRGELVIFNRSHYEDVLVVRVHQLVPEPVWKARYSLINDFENLLVKEGTTILKFFLHIDKDEQKKRLQERLEDKEKVWKFNPQDLKERKLWNQYQSAYEDAIGQTSTPNAPWHIIPANQKWYRDLLISRILVSTLQDLKMNFPKRVKGPKIIID